MQLRKIGLGLILSAAFGLVACGDDSSSSPSASGDNGVSCKVIDNGNTIGYSLNLSGVEMSMTYTFGTDKVTTHIKETFPSSYSTAQWKAACDEAKAEYEEDEDSEETVEVFTCEAGKMELKVSEPADWEDEKEMELGKAYMLYISQSACAGYNGTEPPDPPAGLEDFDQDEEDY